MEHLLAQRVKNLPLPGNTEMARKARALKQQGVDVLDLSLGEPDFKTPEMIQKAAKEAIDSQHFFGYPPIVGYEDLRQVIVEKFKKENNIDTTVEQIVVSTGAKQSISNVLLALLNEGDEVIIYTPHWPVHRLMVMLAGGTPVCIKGGPEHNFKASAQQLQDAITPKTKLVLFCSPSNPSGAVFSQKEVEDMVAVLEKHPEILVMSDEIYEYINFTGNPHVSIGSFPAMKDRTITVNGLSKGFAMTGWRIGFATMPHWLAKACGKIQTQTTSAACSIAQRASIVAIQEGAKLTTHMIEAYRKRRDLAVKLLCEIPGVKCEKPEGAFYLLPDFSTFFGKKFKEKTISNANDLADFILEEARVAVVSGATFEEPRCMRLSTATSEDVLTKAITRMKEALSQLQ